MLTALGVAVRGGQILAVSVNIVVEFLRRNHFFAVVEAFFLRSESPLSTRR